jgi:hypothetical protein
MNIRMRRPTFIIGIGTRKRLAATPVQVPTSENYDELQLRASAGSFLTDRTRSGFSGFSMTFSAFLGPLASSEKMIRSH